MRFEAQGTCYGDRCVVVWEDGVLTSTPDWVVGVLEDEVALHPEGFDRNPMPPMPADLTYGPSAALCTMRVLEGVHIAYSDWEAPEAQEDEGLLI